MPAVQPQTLELFPPAEPLQIDYATLYAGMTRLDDYRLLNGLATVLRNEETAGVTPDKSFAAPAIVMAITDPGRLADLRLRPIPGGEIAVSVADNLKTRELLLAGGQVDPQSPEHLLFMTRERLKAERHLRYRAGVQACMAAQGLHQAGFLHRFKPTAASTHRPAGIIHPQANVLASVRRNQHQHAHYRTYLESLAAAGRSGATGGDVAKLTGQTLVAVTLFGLRQAGAFGEAAAKTP